MTVGIMFFNNHHLPLPLAVTMARRQFEAAEHTKGHKPVVVILNPTQAPEETTICGLTVYTDLKLSPDKIRVCAEWEGVL